MQQHLSLTKLDQKVIDLMNPAGSRSGGLTFSVALLLTSLPKPLQISIAEEVDDKKMPLRVAEHYARSAAAKQHYVIGYGRRPDKSRKALRQFLKNLLNHVKIFSNPESGVSVEQMLAQFPPKDIAMCSEIAAELRPMVVTLLDAVAQAARPKAVAKKK